MQREHRAELSGDVVWHGRTEDGVRLVALVGKHCRCVRGAAPHPVCGAHQLLTDQHTLDHLAFARTVVNRMIDAEWRVSTSASRVSKADWAAFLYACAHAQPTPTDRQESSQRPASGRSALVVSVLALLLVLGLGTPSISFDAPTGQQIASWQTR